MPLPQSDKSYLGSCLAVRGTILDSPGSSVFDLPSQPRTLTNDESKPGTNVDKKVTNDQLESCSSPTFLVISGGTGGNAICSAFGNACYVLPVSDDGGSSSEIIRVLGGPSIGCKVPSLL
jgi:hypothetical protein